MEIGEYAHRFLLEKAKYINRDSTSLNAYTLYSDQKATLCQMPQWHGKILNVHSSTGWYIYDQRSSTISSGYSTAGQYPPRKFYMCIQPVWGPAWDRMTSQSGPIKWM